jgi:hypothetical protein
MTGSIARRRESNTEGKLRFTSVTIFHSVLVGLEGY